MYALNNEILPLSQCRLTTMGKRNTQISREGDRFEVPEDIAILSGLVTTMIEIDKDGDGNDIENGIDKRRRRGRRIAPRAAEGVLGWAP